MDQPTPDPTPPPGRRSTLRRAAAVVAGLVVIGGAIVVLRAPEPPVDQTTRPVPPPQTVVREFAGDGVVIPVPGNPPAQPASLAVDAGPQRLVVSWPPSERAAGYEIRWGRDGNVTESRLVAQPIAQLDALENEVPYEIEVRTVDAFGKRSMAALTSGTPHAPQNEPAWAFQDRFVSRVVPDPVRWRLAGTSDCGRATRGEGQDGRRLVVSGQCGGEPLVLRSRAPLRLTDTGGRMVVETDQPGQSGELTIDLVPGPADLVDGSPSGPPPPGPAGVAQDDPSLPPGTIRVRVAGGLAQTVQVLTAPGMPRLGRIDVAPIQQAQIGISVRWEVVLGADGVRVLRNGTVVGAGNVVPPWREAAVLLGFIAGEAGGLHAAVDLVGFIGAPTTPPVLVAPPIVDAGQVIAAAGSAPLTPAGGPRVSGALGGQLRITLVPTNPTPAQDEFTVDVGGHEYPARPAVPGQPLTRGVRYPIVVDLPADALILKPDKETLPVQVRGPLRRGEGAARIVSASIELVAPPGAVSAASGAGTEVPLTRTRLALARPSAHFLDAAGNPIAENAPVPRGRLVLEVTADGPAGQRLGGELAGLAGVEVRMDGTRIAAIPTVTDGPGIAGTWRIALNTAGLSPGDHTIEVKAVGVDPRAAFAIAYAPFTIG